MKNLLLILLLFVSNTIFSQTKLKITLNTKKNVNISYLRIDSLDNTESITKLNFQKEFQFKLEPLSKNVFVFEQDSIKKYIYINTGLKSFTFNYTILFNNNDSIVVYWDFDLNCYTEYTLSKESMTELNLY